MFTATFNVVTNDSIGALRNKPVAFRLTRNRSDRVLQPGRFDTPQLRNSDQTIFSPAFYWVISYLYCFGRKQSDKTRNMSEQTADQYSAVFPDQREMSDAPFVKSGQLVLVPDAYIDQC